MKGLWCLLLGGTARLLAGAIIIAVPSLAIIAEPVPIVSLHPSLYVTRPPPLKNVQNSNTVQRAI